MKEIGHPAGGHKEQQRKPCTDGYVNPEHARQMLCVNILPLHDG